MDRNDFAAKLALAKGYVPHDRLARLREKLAGADADLVLELAALGLITKEQAKEIALLAETVAETGPEMSEEAAPAAVDRAESDLPTRVDGVVRTARRRQVGGYELLEKIGESPTAEVFRARRPGGSEFVALRMLSPADGDEEFLARLRSRADELSALDHPSVARFVGFGRDEPTGRHFWVTELVEGRNLREVLVEKGSLAEKGVVAIALQMTGVLQRTYGVGPVLGDVSPGNIVITAEGQAKLLDLGPARPRDLPHYASPEQARGGAVDTRSDIYSLGATLYHAATGRAPFEGETSESVLKGHIEGVLDWPSCVKPQLSQGLSRIIARMMAKDPKDRYGTPTELWLDLDILNQGQEPVIASAVSSGEAPPSTVAWPVGLAEGTGEPASAGGAAVPARAAAEPGREHDTLEAEPSEYEGPAEEPAPSGWARGVAAFMPLAALAAAAFFLLRRPPVEPEAPGDRVDMPAAPAAEKTGPASRRDAVDEREESHAGEVPPARPKPLRRGEGPTEEPEDPAGETGEPVAAARPDDEAKKLFEAASRLRADRPDDFRSAIEAFEEVRRRAKGTSYRAKAASETASLRSSWRKKAEAELETAAREAAALAESGDYDAALAGLRSIREDLASQVSREIDEEAARLEAEARRRIDEVLAQAEGPAAEGRAAAVRSLLGSLERIRFREGLAAVRGRVDSLNAGAARLGAEKARERLGALLAEIAGLIEKGEYAPAKRRADEAASGKAPAAVGKDLVLAGEVAFALEARRRAIRRAVEEQKGRQLSVATKLGPRRGTVETVTEEGIVLTSEIVVNAEVRGTNRYVVRWDDLAPEAEDGLAEGWRPEGPAGHVALAFVASGRGDADAAERSLEAAASGQGRGPDRAAGDHPLAGPIRERIRVLRSAEAETDARRAWETLKLRMAARRMSKREGEILLAAIEAFERDHGGTEFAASVRDELASARHRAMKAAVVADPATVPRKDLKLWLRADAGVVLEDGAVSRWEDQSDEGNNAQQGQPPRRPRLVAGGAEKRPCLRFDGVDDQLRIRRPIAWNEFTLVMVARASAPHEVDRQSAAGAGGAKGQKYVLGAAFPGARRAGAGVSLGTNGVSVYEHGQGYMPALAVYEGEMGAAFATVTVRYAARRPSIYLNARLVSEGVVSARETVAAPVRIGGGDYGAFAGDVAEVLMYTRALPDGERSAVERYLVAKYLGARPEDLRVPPARSGQLHGPDVPARP